MKKKLQKITIVFTLLFYYNVSISQTWDSILTGVNKVFSNTLYPNCNEILVLNNTDIIAATHSGVYKSTNQGGLWVNKPIPGAIGTAYIGIKKVNSNRLIALGMGGSMGNSISKSDDSGETWAASTTGILNNEIIEELSMSPNGNIFIAARQNISNPKVYLSTDNGENWIPKNSGFPTNKAIWSVLALNDTIILAGLNDGIYRTTDMGNNWAKVHNTGSGYVVCLKKNSSGIIYAGLASGEIRKSTDNGLTWSITSLVGSGSMIYDIELDSNDNIYVCIYGGGVAKYNNAEILQSILGNSSNGLANLRINDIAIDESGSTPVYYVSSQGTTGLGGAIYRLGGSDVGINELNNQINFTIYPNPSNHSIQIQGVDFKEGVRIKIISIEGKILKDEVTQQSIINISDLSAGMYFIELADATGKTGTKKIIKE